ncbi:Lrp/AsnC family transcriptional regulator [Arthrobacter sp. MMS18-M83]|uniref:Lrp/AsnC family transcriptional regulator n=1 Tax=Arthrobacter sp. MMS18-M83 TaxID=2996261 RepID=UPI00227A2B06|nr:Lrp/AsnC family transcriptional regulator [Arthrobacter sp. MMS18-M83]WAH96278.1 Lrp/AsnC family transcriptional regulator [Arthrobacter sp. MMS18-M83]
MQELVFDELDLGLINALQIQPRVSWAALGRVLDVDPVTLGRRWERITNEGLAWVTGYSDAKLQAGAIVEVEAMPGKLMTLAEALLEHPEVATLDITAGSRDLVLSVIAPTSDALYHYVLDRLERLDFVAKVHSNPISDVLAEASQWRLRALDMKQVDALHALKPEAGRMRRPNEFDGAVAKELFRNGRATAQEIGTSIGANPRRVRESIANQLSSGTIRLRTDITRSASGWPVNAWYFLSLPAAQAERVARQLSRLDEIRSVVSVVGRYNIAMTVWMRTLKDISRLEAAIEEQLPGVRITDRSVVMRTAKLVGTLLDENGRRRGYSATYLQGAGQN